MPDGAYTVTRVSVEKGRASVACAKHHARRLVESSRVEGRALVSEDRIHEYWSATLRMLDSGGGGKFQHRVNAIMTTLIVGEKIWVNVTETEPLPHLEPEARVAHCVIGERERAQLKLSAWIRDRKKFEQSLNGDVLLCTRNGRILEGTTSNFFAVRRACVETALDGVLKGTARALVIKACKTRGIRVVFRAPRVCEARQWAEAFTTNAIRGVCPVSRLYPLNGGNPIEFKVHRSHSLVRRLFCDVRNELGALSHARSAL